MKTLHNMIFFRWLAIGFLVYILLTVIPLLSGGNGKVDSNYSSKKPSLDSTARTESTRPDSLHQDTSESAAERSVNADDVNVRSGPGIDYDAITALDEGRKVKIIEVSGKWSKIDFGEEVQGWIYSPLLSQ